MNAFTLNSEDCGPRDLRVSDGGGGRIHSVDPAAVERFKRILAEQEEAPSRKRRRQASTGRSSGTLDKDLARKRDELLAKARAAANSRDANLSMGESPAGTPDKKEIKTMKSKMTDDAVVAVHRRYVLESISVGKLAKESANVAPNTLYGYFVRLKLPTRTRSQKWQVEDVERVCQAHGLTADQIGPVEEPDPQSVTPMINAPTPRTEAGHTSDALPESAAVGLENVPIRETLATDTSVGAPTDEAKTAREMKPDLSKVPNRAMADPDRRPRPTAVMPAAEAGETAVMASGQTPPSDLRDQLEVIQKLLGMAEAKQVTLRGKISVELHAEIDF